MGHVVAVRTIVIAVIREVGGAVVHNGAVYRRPTGVHVLGVIVICEVVSILDAPGSISPVGPVGPVRPLRGVVGVNNVSAQFGLQLLAALAHFVPINLL